MMFTVNVSPGAVVINQGATTDQLATILERLTSIDESLTALTTDFQARIDAVTAQLKQQNDALASAVAAHPQDKQ